MIEETAPQLVENVRGIEMFVVGWRRRFVTFLYLGGMFFQIKVWTIDQYLMIMENLKKSDSPDPVHLVYASDDKSLIGVQASIRSVKKHASEPVVFHYVGNSPLPSLPDVNFYNLTEVAAKYKLDEYTNLYERGSRDEINSCLANYARFAMDSFLPEHVTKAMWIDADTIVTCDVVSMVRNALSDVESPNIIAAVPKERPTGGFTKLAKEKYNLTRTFNAGVYVVDLNKWRMKNVSKKVWKIAQKNRKKHMYRLGSQPPMQLAIKDRFEDLNWKWNVKVEHLGRDDGKANEEETCLFHWSGGDKPWHMNGTRSDLWKPFAEDS